jgi:hypothetical protein
MRNLMEKIRSYFSGKAKYIVLNKRSFSENQYYNFDYEVYALHEISHAVSLRLYNNYQDIKDKSIIIKKNEDSHFYYRRNEDPNAKELYVDMMVCLSGFISEMELLGVQGTSAYKDIIDWTEEAKRWLTLYSEDYIVIPETEAEVKWNNEVLIKHQSFQASMIRELLRENKQTIFEFVEIVSKKRKATNEEISLFLDNIIVPNGIYEKINQIMDEASIKWN